MTQARPRNRVEHVVAVVVFVLVLPWGNFGAVNEMPRLALAASLVEDHSIELTRFDVLLFFDRADRDGRVYSDKAPGSSIVFAPVYAVVSSWTGWDLFRNRTELRIVARIALSAVPASLLALALMRSVRRESAGNRAWLAAMIVGGTLLLPFTTLAFGHVLAALVAFLAFLLLRPPQSSPGRLVAGGALAGFGVLVEYPLVLVALALLAYRWVIDRRGVPWMLLGAAPMALILGSYHQAAFGSPFTTPYRFTPSFREGFSGVGLHPPDIGDIAATLVGERGFFVITPIVLVAVIGYLLWKSADRSERLDLGVSLVIVVALMLIPSMWSDEATGPYGGASPGPRFATAAMPFLMFPLLHAYRRWPRWVSVVGAISIASMAVATITNPLVPTGDGYRALNWYWEHLSNRIFRFHLLYDWFGSVGVWLWLLVCAVLIGWLVRICRGEEEAVSAETPLYQPMAGRIVDDTRTLAGAVLALLGVGVIAYGFIRLTF